MSGMATVRTCLLLLLALSVSAQVLHGIERESILALQTPELQARVDAGVEEAQEAATAILLAGGDVSLPQPSDNGVCGHQHRLLGAAVAQALVHSTRRELEPYKELAMACVREAGQGLGLQRAVEAVRLLHACEACVAQRKLARELLMPLLETAEEEALLAGSTKGVECVQGQGHSLECAGVAMELVGLLSPPGSPLLTHYGDLAEELLLSYAEMPHGIAYVDRLDSSTALSATHAMLLGSVSLHAASALDLDRLFLAEMAAYVASVPLTSASASRMVSEATHALSASHIVALSLLHTSLSAVDREASLAVRVTDLWGKPLDDVSVFLLSASSRATGRQLAANQPLEAHSGTDFSFSLMATKPEQGYVDVDLAVQKKANKLFLVPSARRSLKIVSEVNVSKVSVAIVDSADGEVLRQHSVAEGETVAESASYYHSVSVSFQVKTDVTSRTAVVQQAFVHVEGPGGELIAVGTLSGASYTCQIDLRDVGSSLAHVSGNYRLQLLVADSFVSNPIRRHLGVIAFEFPPHLVKEDTSVYASKLPIEHQFRQPETRPLAIISLVYAAATAAPLIVLLIGIALVGVDVEMPQSFVSSLLFVVTFCAVFVLYFWYFMAINMFQTLNYLAVLAVAAFLLGHRALSARARRRLQAKEKAE